MFTMNMKIERKRMGGSIDCRCFYKFAYFEKADLRKGGSAFAFTSIPPLSLIYTQIQ